MARLLRRLATLTGIILSFIAGAAMALVASLVLTIANIGGSHVITAGPPSPSLSPQDLYAAMLLKDDKSLDRGMLEYSQIPDLNTETSTQFRVVVVDVGRGPQKEQLFDANTRAMGIKGRWVIIRQDVPTGGIVGVQIVGCENLKCESESSLRQPVLRRGQLAIWYWRITAGTPGLAVITLRADTYDQGSAQTLSEEIVQVPLAVESTSAFEQQQIAGATKSTVGDIVTIGSAATAIAAVGGMVAGFSQSGGSAAASMSAKPGYGGSATLSAL